MEHNSALHFIKSSILGSLLMVLSGVILYSDKIITYLGINNFQMDSRYAEYDFVTFIWSVSTTVSPLIILIILISKLKFNINSTVVPLYCYTLQLWFILFDVRVVDRDYVYWYALGTVAILFPIIKYFKRSEEKSIKERIDTNKRELFNRNEL